MTLDDARIDRRYRCRIRAALHKPVQLGAKGEKVAFGKAIESIRKDARFDVPVRETAAVLGQRLEPHLREPRAYHLGGAVGAGVVDDDHLVGRRGLVENRLQALLKERAAVVGHDDRAG